MIVRKGCQAALGTLASWIVASVAVAAEQPMSSLQSSCVKLITSYQVEAPEPTVQVTSASDIRRKPGAETMGDVFGAYHRRGVVSTDVEGCTLKMFFRLESTIYIAQEASRDACVRQRVLEHERSHFTIQKQAFFDGVQRVMNSDVMMRCVQSRSCDNRDLALALSYRLTEHMEKAAKAGHDGLDSPESLIAEERACVNGAFNEAGGVIRQGKWFR